MKILFSTLLLIIFVNTNYSQNASTYFPASTGYKWYYKNTPLDSLNNPVTAQATYQVDSFSAVQNYQGLLSSVVVSKTGLTSINQNAPYIDTNHYNFQSTNGYYYLNILPYIGSIPFLDSISLVNFLRSFETWYNFYRFGQAVNTNYTIFSKDTTITFDTLTLPLRISTTGRRLNDQTISTVNGNYLAKKFLFTFTVSYGLLPPFIYIPIVTRPDTTYIASGIWNIKEVMPSTNVDLTSLGFNIAFTIPGSLKELTSATVGIINQSNIVAGDYKLYQNYPNPFNPNTIINYQCSMFNYVTLKVYDILGNEVATLVNEKQNPGSYSVEFNGANYSSGIYYYKLKSGDFSEVKKMILLK